MPDPRHPRGQRYPWLLLLALTCLAMATGATSARAIAQWVAHHGDQLRASLAFPLPRIPSESTFGRLLRHVDIARLEQQLSAFAQHLDAQTPVPRGRDEEMLQGVALDGKVLRGAQEWLLSLVRHQEAFVLAQRRVPEHQSESTAAPGLLAERPLAGMVVTADAAFTTQAIAQQILAQGGDYLLVVKSNRAALYQAIDTLFRDPSFLDAHPPDRYTHTAKGHGRLDRRSVSSSNALAGYLDWPGLQQVFQRDLEQRYLASGKVKRMTLYGITSLAPKRAGAQELECLAREHWTIENRVHYVRDDTLREDRCRLRRGHSAEAFAALRNGLLMAFRHAGWSLIPDALRYYAAHLPQTLRLLGLPTTLT